MFQKTGKLIILIIGLICLADLSVFAQTEISINNRPLQDFAQLVNQKVSAKEVDLNAEFLVEMEGVFTKNGKLDLKQTKFTKSEGDKQIVDIAKTAIEAVNDSGWLGYIKELGITKVFVKAQQDKGNIAFVLKGEMLNDSKARLSAVALNFMLKMAVQQKKQIIEKNNPEIAGNFTTEQNRGDEIRLLESLNSSSEGKFFVINFSVAQGVKQEMIERRLKELNEQN
jgi:hypothetical protein